MRNAFSTLAVSQTRRNASTANHTEAFYRSIAAWSIDVSVLAIAQRSWWAVDEAGTVFRTSKWRKVWNAIDVGVRRSRKSRCRVRSKFQRFVIPANRNRLSFVQFLGEKRAGHRRRGEEEWWGGKRRRFDWTWWRNGEREFRKVCIHFNFPIRRWQSLNTLQRIRRWAFAYRSLEHTRCSWSEIQRREIGNSIPIGTSRSFRFGRQLVFQFAIPNVGVEAHCKSVCLASLASMHPDGSFRFFRSSAGQVSFSLTAAIVSIELTITSGGITLSSFQGGISSMVQNCVGTMMPFDVLCNIMKRAGINLFPDDDSFCYCEGQCLLLLFSFELNVIGSEL